MIISAQSPSSLLPPGAAHLRGEGVQDYWGVTRRWDAGAGQMATPRQVSRPRRGGCCAWAGFRYRCFLSAYQLYGSNVPFWAH